VAKPQHQQPGAAVHRFRSDHGGARRKFRFQAAQCPLGHEIGQLHHQGMEAAEQLAAFTGWRAETEPQLAAQVVAAQALVQGLAVVLQSGEIEFPASIGAPKRPDGEVETAAGVKDQPLDRIGAAEGLAGAIPFPQGLCWLEAALGKDRAGSLGAFLGALPFGIDHSIQI
jgi:hypothetical protein